MKRNFSKEDVKCYPLLTKDEGIEVIFERGTLTEALTPKTEPCALFTAEDTQRIAIIREELPQLVKGYLEKKTSCVERIQKNSPGEVVSIKETSHLLKILKVSQNQIFDYTTFLIEKAEALIGFRHVERAKELYNEVWHVFKAVYGNEHVETLKIELRYQTAQFYCSIHASNPKPIEALIEKLKITLSSNSNSNATKRVMARAHYLLAQNYFQNDQFTKAEKYIKQSEALRNEYGATPIELDKLQFFRGKIALCQNNLPEAQDIFVKCYAFRAALNRLNPDLVPILQELINLSAKNNNSLSNARQLKFLTELYHIQMHLQYNERDTVETQLRMLAVMNPFTSDTEYWPLMKRIEAQLNSIPVTEESASVGFSYWQLAEVRMNSMLPTTWAYVEKRAYHRETLTLITKAELHLQGNKNAKVLKMLECLKTLKNNCIRSIEFFKNLNKFKLKDTPLHPKDEAEIALSNNPVMPDNSHSQTSTERDLENLSLYSSEVDYELVEDELKLIDMLAFEQLPDEGMIDPYKLRLAQGGINSTFRDGKKLECMRDTLVKNPKYIQQIPPVEIGIHEGKVYSFDTRRVIVHQQAKELNPIIKIRYKKITGQYLQERVEAVFSARPWNGLVTATRYGGKNSASEAYINPTFRPQLEQKVAKDFKPHPNERKQDLDDPNGFPTHRKKAQKIHSFFAKRALYNDSETSRDILKEASNINKYQGKQAMLDYLVEQKDRFSQNAPTRQ